MKERPYKYMVRLPPSMRGLIAESARHYRRSMNSDIVARLQMTFSGLLDDTAAGHLSPPLHDRFETLFHQDLSDEEARLIRCYRRLPEHKRDALRALLG